MKPVEGIKASDPILCVDCETFICGTCYINDPREKQHCRVCEVWLCAACGNRTDDNEALCDEHHHDHDYHDSTSSDDDDSFM
jgi:hypothetical protein